MARRVEYLLSADNSSIDPLLSHLRGAHPRANVQGALQKLVAKAAKLRLAAWVELTVEERSITLALNDDAQTAAAKLDGCYGLKTDLTPQQAAKEIVHDRYKDLASVEQAGVIFKS